MKSEIQITGLNPDSEDLVNSMSPLERVLTISSLDLLRNIAGNNPRFEAIRNKVNAELNQTMGAYILERISPELLTLGRSLTAYSESIRPNPAPPATEDINR